MEKRLGVWESLAVPQGKGAANGAVNGSPQTSKGTSFDGTVVRVWGSDTVSVIARGNEKNVERKLQLASVRGPRSVSLKQIDPAVGLIGNRGNDPKNLYWANEAKE